MRNRLVLKTVEDWKQLHPTKFEKKRRPSKGHGKPRVRTLTDKEKDKEMHEYLALPHSDEDEKLNKWKIQKDELTRKISRSLLHFHRIYTKGLKSLMVTIGSYCKKKLNITIIE